MEDAMKTPLEEGYSYVRTLRNWAKRQYAEAYLLWKAHGGAEPKYECSYMAAQAVRMQIDRLFDAKSGKCAPDVKPGESWAFRDHRTLGET
jgi:hypothetical protein